MTAVTIRGPHLRGPTGAPRDESGQVADPDHPSPHLRGPTGAPRDESGQVAGIEILPFGVLVFVIGVLFFAQIWGVVEARSAVTSASREAARAFVETPAGYSDAEALAGARRAGLQSMSDQGRSPERTTVSAVGSVSLRRCTRVTFEVSYRVPILNIPLLSGLFDGIVVRSRHSEIVDPLRDGLEGVASCVGR